MNPLVELVFGPLLTVHQWLYEHSDGRIGASLGGRPMLLLRTVGRRTKQPRTAALLYVRDGDAYVVIASKGGAPQHPGWFHNLTAQPDVEIQVGRERIPVRARVAEGEERSRLWARADEINQGQYADVPVPHEPRDPGRGARAHAIEAFRAYVRERCTGPGSPATADEMKEAANMNGLTLPLKPRGERSAYPKPAEPGTLLSRTLSGSVLVLQGWPPRTHPRWAVRPSLHVALGPAFLAHEALTGVAPPVEVAVRV